MHLLYCDESNLQERSGDFLIYGGLMIEASQAKALSSKIDEIRQRAGVEKGFKLKFNPGPVGMSHEDFIRLKQDVLEAAINHGAKLLTYLTLHDLAREPDVARRYGINTVCYHFHCALNRTQTPGLVLIDRFNDAGNAIDAHLSDKFSTGVQLPYSGDSRLTNIIGFHYSSVGQSHMPSVIDIILGSLRFSINAHTRGETGQQPTAQRLLALLAPLFFREEGSPDVNELGLMFSPKAVTARSYRDRYQSLKDFLVTNGIAVTQEITAERRY